MKKHNFVRNYEKKRVQKREDGEGQVKKEEEDGDSIRPKVRDK